VAIGEQDTDCSALVPPPGIDIIGASSDHLVLDCGSELPPVGAELRFGLGYSALVRAMTSPFVSQVLFDDEREPGSVLRARTHVIEPEAVAVAE
jgi:predicted amino acid racemase